MVLLEDGGFHRIDSMEEWNSIKDNVVSLWDSGEMLVGFGEFLENNKNLVPSPYNKDWWAADLAEYLDQPQKVEEFASIIGISRENLPPGLPFNGAISRGGEPALDRVRRRRDWNRYLRNLEMDWQQIKRICIKFGTAPPPPFNPWWSDLPLSFTGKLIEALLNSKIKNKGLRIPDVVQGWSPEQKLEDIGLDIPSTGAWPRWTEVETHGVIKSSLLVLGIQPVSYTHLTLPTILLV